jgi:uncharacterized protein YdeI (YjbR/CyaY-like superfamily)
MKPRFFRSAEEFGKWLERQHGDSSELLVGFYNRKSGRGGLTYGEALNHALCFGWIDGIRKNSGEDSYTIRFTPRRPGSAWSEVNIRHVERLIEQGLMHESGLGAFGQRDPEKTKRYSYEERSRGLDEACEATFRSNAEAWAFFEDQPPGYRRTVSWWVMSAKREETRQKRLATLIDESRTGRRLPMLTSPYKITRAPA